MKVLKKPDSTLFIIDEIDEDTLVALYNACLNQKSYLKEMIKMQNHQLKKFMPQGTPDEARKILRLNITQLEKYIEMWNDTINPSKQDKSLEN